MKSKLFLGIILIVTIISSMLITITEGVCNYNDGGGIIAQQGVSASIPTLIPRRADTNSGVGNKWFYLLSDGGFHHGVTVTGIGVENAMQIAYRANSYYWSTNTNYHQAALATLSALTSP